jgi:hypothetical protein
MHPPSFSVDETAKVPPLAHVRVLIGQRLQQLMSLSTKQIAARDRYLHDGDCIRPAIFGSGPGQRFWPDGPLACLCPDAEHGAMADVAKAINRKPALLAAQLAWGRTGDA